MNPMVVQNLDRLHYPGRVAEMSDALVADREEVLQGCSPWESIQSPEKRTEKLVALGAAENQTFSPRATWVLSKD